MMLAVVEMYPVSSREKVKRIWYWLWITGAMLAIGALGCTSGGGGSYDRLALYLSTPSGFEDWQRGEKELKEAVHTASETYRAQGTIEALPPYEKAVREYLDHGFFLYHAFTSTNHRLPPDIETSLSGRLNQLMDVADAYVQKGSIPVGVSLAREVVLKYSDSRVMGRAHHRAESMLLHYRYKQDY